MRRELLRQQLENYHPTDGHEIASKARMLDFLNTYENCFDRELSCGHFTGSCWIENHDGTKFLLTLHKKIGLWLQLGGHADGCEDLQQVALKEAREESGLQNFELISNDIFDVDIHMIEPYRGVPAHYHYDVRFLFRAIDDDDAIKISEESNDLKWFSELPTELSNLGKDAPRMFKKWKERKAGFATKKESTGIMLMQLIEGIIS